MSFYINLEEGTTYATNKMGAYLDDGSIDTVSICSKPITFVRPQVYTDSVIKDTLNWVKIEGSFVANGTERFITLGNFFPKDSVTYIVPFGIISHQWAYYLIDDVSVVESGAQAQAGPDRWVELSKSTQIGPVEDSTARGMDCHWYHKGMLIDSGNVITVNANSVVYAVDTYVVVQNVCGIISRDTMLLRTVGLGVQELAAEKGFNVFPNPTTGKLTITSLRGGATTKQSVTATVFDILGRAILQSKIQFHNNESTLNIDAPKGIYILELQDEIGAKWRERIIIE